MVMRPNTVSTVAATRMSTVKRPRSEFHRSEIAPMDRSIAARARGDKSIDDLVGDLHARARCAASSATEAELVQRRPASAHQTDLHPLRAVPLLTVAARP